LENIPKFDGVFQVKSTEEVQQALDGYISHLEGTQEGTTTDTTSELVVNEETPSVLAAFNELTGN
jgi:hypothetical protein